MTESYKDAKTLEFLHFPLWTYELQDTQTKRVTKQKSIVSESDFDNNAIIKSYSYALVSSFFSYKYVYVYVCSFNLS